MGLNFVQVVVSSVPIARLLVYVVSHCRTLLDGVDRFVPLHEQ